MRCGLLLCLSVGLQAADLAVDDIRADGGILAARVSTESQSTVTPVGGGPASTTTNSEVDRMFSLREGIEGFYGDLGPHGGFLWGLGFSVSHYYFSSYAGDVRIVNPCADVFAGYGYAFRSWLHVEAAPFIGGGWSLYSASPDGGAYASDRSRYFEYGLHLGLYATFAESWQAGLEIPTYLGHARMKYFTLDAAGDETVTTQRNIFRATGVQFSFGIHF